jgi:hypothetical protein
MVSIDAMVTKYHHTRPSHWPDTTSIVVAPSGAYSYYFSQYLPVCPMTNKHQRTAWF